MNNFTFRSPQLLFQNVKMKIQNVIIGLNMANVIKTPNGCWSIARNHVTHAVMTIISIINLRLSILQKTSFINNYLMFSVSRLSYVQ